MISYFMENIWQAWLLLSVLLLILELTNGDFFIMCFSIGALASCIASAFGAGLYMQLAVFSVVSVVCLFFLRPVALKCMHKDEKLSNVDAIIGRIATVSESFEDGEHGRVALDGDDWKAVSLSGVSLKKGDKVKIVSRESIIVTVEPA